jgi:hypothetical protein
LQRATFLCERYNIYINFNRIGHLLFLIKLHDCERRSQHFILINEKKYMKYPHILLLILLLPDY